MSYVSDESGKLELYLRRYPAVENPVQISRGFTRSVRAAVWGRDGRSVRYILGDSLMTAALDLSGDQARVLSRRGVLAVAPTTQVVDQDPKGDRLLVFHVAQGSGAETPTAEMPKLVVVTNWLNELKKAMAGG
jgi:hypothetical protein